MRRRSFFQFHYLPLRKDYYLEDSFYFTRSKRTNYRQPFFNWFIILCVFIALLKIAFAYDPCIIQHNDSVSDYVECMDYYEGLEVSVINNITIIRNITNNITSADDSIDLSNLATKSYVKTFSYTKEELNELILLLLENKRDEILNDESLSNLITLKYLQDNYLTADDIEAKYLEPLDKYKLEFALIEARKNLTIPNQVTADQVSQLVELIVDSKLDGSVSKSSGFDISTKVFLVLIFIIIVGAYFFREYLRETKRQPIFDIQDDKEFNSSGQGKQQSKK